MRVVGFDDTTFHQIFFPSLDREMEQSRDTHRNIRNLLILKVL